MLLTWLVPLCECFASHPSRKKREKDGAPSALPMPATSRIKAQGHPPSVITDKSRPDGRRWNWTRDEAPHMCTSSFFYSWKRRIPVETGNDSRELRQVELSREGGIL
jgi:hypothetical protein